MNRVCFAQCTPDSTGPRKYETQAKRQVRAFQISNSGLCIAWNDAFMFSKDVFGKRHRSVQRWIFFRQILACSLRLAMATLCCQTILGTNSGAWYDGYGAWIACRFTACFFWIFVSFLMVVRGWTFWSLFDMDLSICLLHLYDLCCPRLFRFWESCDL